MKRRLMFCMASPSKGEVSARAPVKMHKQTVKILDRFVQIAYCNPCPIVLYYNCSKGRGKTPANEDRNSPFPTEATPLEQKIRKKFEKPLDKPPQVCYNGYSEREREAQSPPKKI